MYLKQKTLNQKVTFEGVGVHNGVHARLTLCPAAVDQGVIIKNTHLPHTSIQIGKVIPEIAHYATVLCQNGWKVGTIEHVMAVIGMLNIDNVIIELEGDEFPILDGSSLPFVEKILMIGLVEQNAQKQFITPRAPLSFYDEQNDRALEILPADNSFDLYIDYQAFFDHPVVKSGSMQCTISHDFFVKELAPARTFGFLSQLPFMQRLGLAKGSSLENTVVIGDSDFINERRFSDECLRHKVLDLLGDLSLLGKRLAGRVKARKTGHSFNRLVIEHFIKNPDAWRFL